MLFSIVLERILKMAHFFPELLLYKIASSKVINTCWKEKLFLDICTLLQFAAVIDLGFANASNLCLLMGNHVVGIMH